MQLLIDGEAAPREVEVCPTCGSLVIDWDAHEAWHERLMGLARALGYDGPVCDPECRDPQSKCSCDRRRP